MLKFNLTPKSIQNYLYDGFDRILRIHIENGLTQYSQEHSTQLVTDAHNDYMSGKMCRSVYQNVRRIAALIDEVHETKELTWRYLPAYGLREPNSIFAELLTEFCKNANRTGIIKTSTVATVKSAIRRFLFELENVGIYSFEGISLKSISECLTNQARNYTNGMSSALFGIRIFLRFLFDNGTTEVDLSIAIPEMVATRKPIREGFTDDDISKLFSEADITTDVGKRDYAIMMLASQTGLRACDISNLKRHDINWRTKEIRIAQTKTGRALSLHLPTESGNAIADYILNARPKCEVANIFICKDRPFRYIRNRSMSSIIYRYMRKTGITDSPVKRRGFHSFRRSFGRQLLESEISLDMLNELLGHSQMDSSKPYIAIDEVGLKKCALPLVSMMKVGDEA
jgi:site-specific recombinase XerD